MYYQYEHGVKHCSMYRSDGRLLFLYWAFFILNYIRTDELINIKLNFISITYYVQSVLRCHFCSVPFTSGLIFFSYTRDSVANCLPMVELSVLFSFNLRLNVTKFTRFLLLCFFQVTVASIS